MVNEGEKFVIIRFSAQTATHDFGYAGIPLEYKIKCVEEFQKNAKVFISSEAHPGAYLEKFLIKIPPEKMPDALCYAALVYSEGAKTASEASLLGTPAIYVDFKGRDYTREQEKKYGTIFNFGSSKNDYKQSIQKGVDVLNKVNVKQEWREKRKKILNDNIDITAFMVWFIENYPESFAIIKKDPQYQFRFM
jgi:predicted glycosyltransferase